jgi:hypothetical protein
VTSTYRLILDASALPPQERDDLEAAIERLGFPRERWIVLDGPKREGELSAEEWDRLEAGLRPWASRIELQVSSA